MMKRGAHDPSPTTTACGFTIVELLIAGVIAAMVFSVLAVSMTQVVQAKNISKERLDAHMRANVALKNLRRDLDFHSPA